MPKLIFLLLVLTCASASAQLDIHHAAVTASGNTESLEVGERTFRIQSSVGQSSLIGTSSTSRFMVTQGFIQPRHGLTVSLQEDQLIVDAWPNPFTDQVTISVDHISNDPITIALYDLNGKAVLTSQAAVKQLTLDLSFLARGTYIMKVMTGKAQYTTRLIKL